MSPEAERDKWKPKNAINGSKKLLAKSKQPFEK
jgi:hypothetical protein